LRTGRTSALVVIVSELGERRLLARIRDRLGSCGRPSSGVVIGIGDDAAVVTPSRNAQTVLTTDAQVEGVHFERRFSAPADIGYRALAVNVSDLAAMGARPRWALLSLVLPDHLLVADLDGLIGGVAAAAGAYGMVVIGGNLARSPGPLFVDMMAVGEVGRRRLLTRDGGRPGDELYVSGTIGGARAGLEMLRAASPAHGRSLEAATAGPEASCVARYRRPEPRVRLGLAIAQARAARAAMDLSDGLADAVRQVGEASGCGADIDAAALPIDPSARQWWETANSDPVEAALSGGDDYELLLAVPRTSAGRLRHARTRVSEPALTRIGVLTKDRSAFVVVRDGRRDELPGGFEHWGKAETWRTKN
jgi:thiamine-monophosphate kinase